MWESSLLFVCAQIFLNEEIGQELFASPVFLWLFVHGP